MKLHCSLAALALGLCLLTNSTFADEGPPNWKVLAFGSTRPDGSGLDLDAFAGESSHLGEFTGEGAHTLNPITGMFAGFATYTADNGDQLDVEYTGQVVGFDPYAEFPFLVIGDFKITGGTGRLKNATGCAKMTGGFTGVQGDLFFELDGTLHPQGK